MQRMVDHAIADVSKRQGQSSRSAGEVHILRAERVTWRSAAMGCPLPDRGYKMVLTPGVLILLRSRDAVFEYHGARGGTPFLCEPPATIETPAPGQNALDLT